MHTSNSNVIVFIIFLSEREYSVETMQSDTLIVVNSVRPLSLDQVYKEINDFIVSTDALTNEAQTSEEAVEKLKVVMEAVAEYKVRNVGVSITPVKNVQIETAANNSQGTAVEIVSADELKKSHKKSKKRKSEVADRDEIDDTGAEKVDKEHKKKKSKKEDKDKSTTR